MMQPPVWMRLHIVENQKTKIKLWFPVIIIWIILLLLAILLSPLIIIAAIILWPRSHGKRILLLGPAFFYLIGSMRGLTVLTQSPKDQVYIYFH
jgi:uncharacterized membrane protein YqjE